MADTSPPRISNDLVGTRFELPEREISWRETTNYAAAVGDLNPRYFDDRAGKTLIAPPTLAVAITWPVYSGKFRVGPVSLLPKEVAVTAVHAGQHLVFSRPIRAGERISVRGRLISIQPTRAGAYAVTQLDLVAASGETVVTEYSGAMYRGVECPDGGRTIAAVPAVPERTASNAPIRESPITVGRGLPYIYDGCTNIIDPIHTSPAFARERAKLPDIVLQGTCSLALAAREIVNIEAEGDPARLETLACRFSRFVIPGTTARLQILHTAPMEGKLEVFFQLLNAEGRPAMTSGFARIAG